MTIDHPFTDADAIRRRPGMYIDAIVCVRLHDPTYGEPTKSRLTTPEAKRAVSSAVRAAFAAFARCNATLLGYFTGDP
ncbi:hypothetical protein [Sorangium sp. So ce1000]|uniref:hypothetical protein n=1 Tax=Sorangium sp. So ce1000 TaxID=3133325 RepID=UPI003F615843